MTNRRGLLRFLFILSLLFKKEKDVDYLLKIGRLLYNLVSHLYSTYHIEVLTVIVCSMVYKPFSTFLFDDNVCFLGVS